MFPNQFVVIAIQSTEHNMEGSNDEAQNIVQQSHHCTQQPREKGTNSCDHDLNIHVDLRTRQLCHLQWATVYDH